MTRSRSGLPDSVPVLIAGAGPVGLSLATALAHHGVRSLVVERKAAPSEHSRAPGILPRTLEILRIWGVLEPFLAEGDLVEEPTVWTVGRDRPRLRLPLHELADETAIPALLVLPQNRTEALLAAHLARSPLAEVRFGHAFHDFAESEAGVTATIASDGSTYEVRAEFLAGCDGASSDVRGRLGWQLEGATYPARIMLADVILPDARDELPWPRVAAEPPLLFGLRLAPRLWRLIDPIAADVSDAEAVSRTRIERQVERLFGAGSFETVWSSVFRIHCRNSPHFRRRHVLLAGDAAHINSPAGGQGMNSGIEDAHNLGWKLARALDGGDLETLLASYELERRPVVLTSIDRYTDLLTRYVLLGNRVTRALLFGSVRAALWIGPLRRRILRRLTMLDTHYRDSPLLGGSGPWIGRRIPDVPLETDASRSIRLHDLCGRRACLVWCEPGTGPFPDWERIREAVGEVADVAVVVTEGQPARGHSVDRRRMLFRQLGVRRPTAILVRPDGYIGWMAERPGFPALHEAVGSALGAANRTTQPHECRLP
jgi:2-polyprenyl-6-methoxyphenol hydroxylase-like FAD-dependent oxidoreductase